MVIRIEQMSVRIRDLERGAHFRCVTALDNKNFESLPTETFCSDVVGTKPRWYLSVTSAKLLNPIFGGEYRHLIGKTPQFEARHP